MYLGSPRSSLPELSLLVMLGFAQYREITPHESPMQTRSFKLALPTISTLPSH